LEDAWRTPYSEWRNSKTVTIHASNECRLVMVFVGYGYVVML